MRICPICKNEYDTGGNAWKKVCYDCYKNYRYLQTFGRIHPIGHKSNVYLSHPNVTKEEMDEWIRNHGKEVGWGAEEWKPENFSKFKIWTDSTNFD